MDVFLISIDEDDLLSLEWERTVSALSAAIVHRIIMFRCSIVLLLLQLQLLDDPVSWPASCVAYKVVLTN